MLSQRENFFYAHFSCAISLGTTPQAISAFRFRFSFYKTSNELFFPLFRSLKLNEKLEANCSRTNEGFAQLCLVLFIQNIEVEREGCQQPKEHSAMLSILFHNNPSSCSKVLRGCWRPSTLSLEYIHEESSSRSLTDENKVD